MEVVIKAGAAYWILLFSVRLIGRRAASMMAPFDLVVLFLFAGTTITAVLGDDHSMTAALSAIFTIDLMHIFASWKGRHGSRAATRPEAVVTGALRGGGTGRQGFDRVGG